REAAMRWMRRWLLQKDDAPKEGDFPIFKDADLQCTRSGQVLEDFKGKSVVHFNTERAKELAIQRVKLYEKASPEDLLKEMRSLLGLPAVVQDATDVTRRKPKEVGPFSGNPWGQPFVFTTEPGIVVPALLFSAAKEEKGRLPLVLYVHDEAPLSPGKPSAQID